MLLKITLSLLAILSVACLSSCFDASKVAARPEATAITKTMPSTIFQFTVNALDGKPVALEQFRGKKIIVLNVASKCGYTPQYADWEKFILKTKTTQWYLVFRPMIF